MKRARVSGAVLALAIAAAGLAAPSSAAAVGMDLYVDDSYGAVCSDQGPGTAAQPYCSVQSAADVAVPGTTVHVSGPQQALAITRSGEPGAPISFVSGGPWWNAQALSITGVHDVEVHGASVVTVRVSGSSSVTLDRLDVYPGSLSPAVDIDGSSAQVTLSRSEVDSSVTSVQVEPGAQGVVITTNRIVAEQQGVDVSGASGTDIVSNTFWTAAVAVDHGATGTVIENNVANHPISVAADSAAGTRSDYNYLAPFVAGGPLYQWAGKDFSDLAGFRTVTGQGGHDLTGVAFDVQNSAPTPGIDNADASAPGELSTDMFGRPRVDDPLVPNTGTGSGFYDRGAFETEDPFAAAGPTVWPTHVAYNSTVAFTAADANPWGDSVSRTYDFGDGSPKWTTTDPVVHHTYGAVAGGGSKRYQVTVSETNPLDGTVSNFTRWETVSPPGPLAVYYPYFGLDDDLRPLAVTYEDADYQTPFDVSSCSYDFGDGSKPFSAGCWQIKHTYSRPGLYTVRVTVLDAGGRRVSFTRSLSVGPEFERTKPTELLDTYTGTGGVKGVILPGKTLRLKIAGRAGVPSTASSVELSIRAAGAGVSGSVTAYADGRSRPPLPSMFYPARQISTGLITVPIGANGYVDLSNLAGRAYLAVEVEGYQTVTPTFSGLIFYPEAEQATYGMYLKVFDTLSGYGETKPGQGARKLGPGSTYRFAAVPGGPSNSGGWNDLAGQGADMVLLNVQTQDATAATRLTFQGGLAGAVGGSVYAYPGQTHLTTLLVPLDGNGMVTVRNSAGWTNATVTVEGFYRARTSAFSSRSLVTVPSTMVLDTVTGVGGFHGAVQDRVLRIKVAGVNGLPSGMSEVALRVAGLSPRAGGLVYSDSVSGSLLALNRGLNEANLVYLPVVNGYAELQAGLEGPAYLTASVEGYYAAG